MSKSPLRAVIYSLCLATKITFNTTTTSCLWSKLVCNQKFTRWWCC